jgi:hypothetical protein
LGKLDLVLFLVVSSLAWLNLISSVTNLSGMAEWQCQVLEEIMVHLSGEIICGNDDENDGNHQDGASGNTAASEIFPLLAAVYKYNHHKYLNDVHFED